jgi:hypothetical protein
MTPTPETMKGTLSLFGYPSTEARLQVQPRSRRWRWTRAGFFFGSGLLAAPVVGLVPPHAPWVLGALGLGGFMGTRKWKERFTVLSLEGPCPKCGEGLAMKAGAPLKPTMTVSCGECNHDARLEPEFSAPPS